MNFTQSPKSSIFHLSLLGLLYFASGGLLAQDQEARYYKVVAQPDEYEGRTFFKVMPTDNRDLSLRRGDTAIFDLSDASLQTHPFRLSSTRDGSHSGGSSMGAVRNGTSVAITVGTDSPDRLYFYCDNHKGMGDKSFLNVSGNTTDLFLSDFNESLDELYIPRVYVETEPPRLYSVKLGVSQDRSSFRLISASEGVVSTLATLDRRQASFNPVSNQLNIPALYAMDNFFEAKLQIGADVIKLIHLKPLGENIMTDSYDPDQSADGQPSNNWAIKYSNNY